MPLPGDSWRFSGRPPGGRNGGARAPRRKGRHIKIRLQPRKPLPRPKED